jgi:hypothetical protein
MLERAICIARRHIAIENLPLRDDRKIELDSVAAECI